MKTTMKTLLLLVCAILVPFGTSEAATYTLGGSLDVSQATTNGGLGAGEGNGTGTIAGSYDDATNLLDYTVTWQDLLDPGTVTNMHFHAGAAGVQGGVDLGIDSPWVSPLSRNSILLDDTKEATLLAGNWYVNIHTSNFGGGEIRGQVTVAPVPEQSSGNTAAIALLSVLLFRRRRSAKRDS